MNVQVKNDSGHAVVFERIRTKGGRLGWSRWRCTCGKVSRVFMFPGFSESAGRQHAQATGGWAGAWRAVDR